MLAPGGDSINAIMTLGVNALETNLETAYGMGTSFAVPHVVGFVALLKSFEFKVGFTNITGSCASRNSCGENGIITPYMSSFENSSNVYAAVTCSCPQGSACGGLYQCFICSSGYYCPGGLSAPVQCSYTTCPAGYWIFPSCTSSTNGICNFCRSGTYCEGGTTAYYDCTDGSTYQNQQGQSSCLPCSVCGSGLYRSTQCSVSANTQCSPWTTASCTAGNYLSTPPSAYVDGFCTPCTTSGYFCAGGIAAQVLCAVGSFCASTSTKAACTTPNYCPPGSTAQNPCPIGYYCPDPSTKTACIATNYCPPGSTAQNPCPDGYYCPDPFTRTQCTTTNLCLAGSTAQNLCPAGYYCPDPSTKMACSTSYFCPPGSIAQNPCPVGYYCPDPSTKTACTTPNYCPPGSTAQNPCPAGYYCPDPFTRTQCTTTNLCLAGSIAQNPCPAGYYCPDPLTKTPCSQGSYCPASQIAATPCPAGTHGKATLSSTSANCEICLAGTYSTAGSGACTSCSTIPGTFSADRAASCTTCTVLTCVNQYKVDCKLTSDTTCQSCSVAPGPYGAPPANANFVSLTDPACAWTCNIGYYLNQGTNLCVACTQNSIGCSSGQYRQKCVDAGTSDGQCVACTNAPVNSVYTGVSTTGGIANDGGTCPFDCKTPYSKQLDSTLCCPVCTNGNYNSGCSKSSSGSCATCSN